jgi:hypothetical protein
MVEMAGIMFLTWLGLEMVKGLKERGKEEGYTKIDYVAIVFLIISSLLVILKITVLLLNTAKGISIFN